MLYCFFGYHKCATTFLDQKIFHAIAEQLTLKKESIHSPALVDFDLNAFIENNEVEFFSFVNADYQFVKDVSLPFRGVQIVRDPRDILVSAFFSHKHSHSTVGWPELDAYREKISKLDDKNGLLAEIEFTSTLTTDGYNIKPFELMKEWNYSDRRIHHIRYEDFVQDQFGTLYEAVAFLKLVDSSILDKVKRIISPQTAVHKLTKNQLRTIVEENSFQNISGGRQTGSENKQSHYRKGTPGDWKNYFDDELKQAFKQTFPNLVSSLGYEKNEDW